MLTRLTGTLTAAAVALSTLGAAPARADNNDAARVAAALVGIAILGKILSDRNDDDGAVTRYQTAPAPVYRPAPAPVYRPAPQYHPAPVYRPAPRYHPAPVYRPRTHAPRVQQIRPRHANPGVIAPRPVPPRVRYQNTKLLPKACFKSYPTRRGTAYLFNGRCLDRNFRHAHALPNACATRIRTQGQVVRGYDARCLRGRGYALARG